MNVYLKELQCGNEAAMTFAIPGQTAGLTWFDNKGVGWFPVHEGRGQAPDYWEVYQALETSPMTGALNKFRVGYVLSRVCGRICDVGIGNGAFLRALGDGRGYGYGVEQKAVAWLAEQGRWLNPYEPTDDVAKLFMEYGIAAVTLWDTLEHLRKPEQLFARVNGQMLFVSIPIFRDIEHLLQSKHLKPLEHYWYFTDAGFKQFMEWHGFTVLESTDAESRLGREDITTYVLRRQT